MIDYPAHLETMWQKAIAPREPNAPTVISTFAGGGGSSTGYMMAGFRELLAVEWDDNAVQTLRLNYPHLDIYHGDIAKLSVEEVLRRTGLQPGQLDVFDGSPPCQGFSTAGKRDFDDDRNQLFREYVRLLRGLQPKVFVMENVSGMVKGKMKLIFADILRELKASGYKVSARLLNAMYFHVPQSRERMIFIGVREDLGIEPSHPKAESKPITVKMAWNGLPENTEVESLGHCWKSVKPGSKTETSLMKTKPGGRVGSFGGSRRFAFDAVASTISTGGLLPGYPGSSWPSHPSQLRGISMREGARCCSFPDGFSFGDDWVRGAKRIGNSVPPLFMEAIARHIRTQILDKLTL
jgi:DNA (cytosine-5)-methyltransferase 1